MARGLGRRWTPRLLVLSALAPLVVAIRPTASSAAAGALGTDPLPVAPWVVAENRRAGTTAWRIPERAPGGIQGYADHVSVSAGHVVGLHVSTRAPYFHVDAYRIGYYGGAGGRLVWRSGRLRGRRGGRPTIRSPTNTVEAGWPKSVSIAIGRAWVQGDYLLKLVSSDGGQAYVPLTIRDDSSTADIVVQNAVTTWQAYNRWGGYSLYEGPDGRFSTRSRVVSFDRPYKARRGAGAFPWMEQPFVVWAERNGLDVTYQTDIDLHERPQLLQHHSALVTLGHDEYWSGPMREGALDARDAGVNIAFLGGNAVYRHIRLQASPLGRNRRIVCYKVAREDPLYGIDDAAVTSNWRDPPVPRPESELLGALYRCARVHAPLVVSEPGAWVFDGTGLARGARLEGVVHLEVDGVAAWAPTPDTIEILAHSPVSCAGRSTFADMTYYTTTSHAGVLDVGNQGWVDALRCLPPDRASSCNGAIVRVTRNVVAGFAAGPAGRRHPSVPNLAAFGITLRRPIHP
jgi:hypothetical protein